MDRSKAKFETTKSGKFILSEGVVFEESIRIIQHVQDENSDQAVLRLSTRAKGKPLPLISSHENEIQRCWIAGYGINNQNYMGVLYSSVLNSQPVLKDGLFVVKSSFHTPLHLKHWYLVVKGEDLRSNFPDILKNIETRSLTNSITTPGDSGGPFICQKNNGEIGAIGVIRSTVFGNFIDQLINGRHDWDWFNQFSPINFELIQKMK